MKDLYHLLRLSASGATLVLPLLGAASADRQLAARRAVGLLGVAAAFHAFAYLHNDLCDLALDRTQPRRAQYPLVRGSIAPRAALILALACVPAAFLIDRLFVKRRRACSCSNLPLALAFALLAAYNIWGKRCPLPPLTDALQGVGWAALLRYGALATGHRPSRLTHLLEAYELLLIVMVNGLHGGLRDLENDAAHGARTTATLFGATVDAGGSLRLPPALIAYALVLQAGLLALPLWGALHNFADYQRGTHRATVAGVAAVSIGTLAVFARAAQGEAGTEAGMAHLMLLLSAPLALVAPGMRPDVRRLLLLSHLLPLLSNSMSFDALCWALGARPSQG